MDRCEVPTRVTTLAFLFWGAPGERSHDESRATAVSGLAVQGVAVQGAVATRSRPSLPPFRKSRVGRSASGRSAMTRVTPPACATGRGRRSSRHHGRYSLVQREAAGVGGLLQLPPTARGAPLYLQLTAICFENALSISTIT